MFPDRVSRECMRDTYMRLCKISRGKVLRKLRGRTYLYAKFFPDWPALVESFKQDIKWMEEHLNDPS